MVNNRLKGHVCYLAGSIDKSNDYGREWRYDISSFLNGLDIGVLNPCDKPIINKKINEDEDFVEMVQSLKNKGKYLEVQEIMKEIVRIDLKMVDLCNFMILNVVPEVHMCGSYNEQSLACYQRKPIIVHCESGIHRIPNWLFGICDPDLFFSKWEYVKDYIKHIAYSESVDDNDSKWRFLDYNKIFGVPSYDIVNEIL